MRLVAAVAGSVLAASAGAGAARPPVALITSPAHLALAGSARASLAVTNSGTDPVDVDVTRAGFALDLRGRPRVAARPFSWLAVAPRRLALAPGATATLTVTSRVPSGAEPGDHSELVLLSTRSPTARGLPVRVRLGVVVVVRAPGKVVRRIMVVRILARRTGRARVLGLLLANRGNVTETVGGTCALVWLHRRGRILARLRAPARRILPHTSGLVELAYRGPAHGRVLARIVPPSRPGCPRIRSREVAVTL
ncbi:MAG: hypothetical protein ACM3QU_05960 [Verrucomicrobiota bacterium]